MGSHKAQASLEITQVELELVNLLLQPLKFWVTGICATMPSFCGAENLGIALPTGLYLQPKIVKFNFL